MYEVMIEDNFSAAHNLRGYGKKCEKLHGHNWKVQIVVRSEKLDRIGMVMDFKEMKRITKKVLRNLDHTHLNKIAPFTRINPTAENIARHIFEKLYSKVSSFGFSLGKVSVWESENSRATYNKSKNA